MKVNKRKDISSPWGWENIFKPIVYLYEVERFIGSVKIKLAKRKSSSYNVKVPPIA